MTGNLNKRLVPPQAKRLVWLAKGEGEPCKQGETSTQSGCVPAEGEAKVRQNGPEETTKVYSKTADILNLLAGLYEKKHGWVEGRTREGFIKNWKKKLKGTEGTPEQVSTTLASIDEARKKYDLPDVPVVVRKPIEGEDSEDMGGQWNKYWGVIVMNPDPKFLPEIHKPKKMGGGERVGAIPEFYDDHTAGVLVHESGHALETPEQASRAEDVLDDPEKRKIVKEGLSWYAARDKQELVAEAYAAKKHPDFDKLPDEVKKIVSFVLTGSEVNSPKIPPTELTGKSLLFAPFKGFGRRRSVGTERSLNIVQPVPAPRQQQTLPKPIVTQKTAEANKNQKKIGGW